MKVDYVIIGAGMAGTVLRRFLKSDSCVLLDPNPGGFKIGESIIPEHFHHPELAALLPEVQKLPSFSPKWGTTFVSGDSVASFPLPTRCTEVAMHVAREELEPLMHRMWETPIVRERVVEVDIARKIVRTDDNTYEVAKQILDCSGPAMVVARSLGDTRELWPVYARWQYFDIEAIDDALFREHIRDSGLEYLRYDAVHGKVLPGDEEDGWQPSKTTLLTQVEPGVWTWQIPLYHERLLSFGVVSRHGKISDERLAHWTEASRGRQYTLRERPRDKSHSFNRLHVRDRFAVVANRAATMDYILLADAYAFADPVYSVGTGLAVNKAIELAALLNDGGWTEARCERYNAQYEKLIDRAIAAFQAWYSGDLFALPEKTREVQHNFLVGSAFQVGIATHYGEVLVDASLTDQEQAGRAGIPASGAPVHDEVQALLGLADTPEVAGWRFAGARRALPGLQLRWHHEAKPELTVHLAPSEAVTQCYRRVGEVSLSFMNLFDGPYPLGEEGRALFDELERRVRRDVPAWRQLAGA